MSSEVYVRTDVEADAQPALNIWVRAPHTIAIKFGGISVFWSVRRDYEGGSLRGG